MNHIEQPPVAHHFIAIIPSYAEFAAEFDRRLTQPFDDEDALTAAEKSILANVAMAHFFDKQWPIPNSTSAAAAVVHVIGNVTRQCATFIGQVPERFIGSHDATGDAEELAGESHDPLRLIGTDNDWNLRLYRLVPSEVAGFVTGEVFEQLAGAEFKDAVVLAWAEGVPETD